MLKFQDALAKWLLSLIGIGAAAMSLFQGLSAVSLWPIKMEAGHADEVVKYGALAAVSALLLRVGQLVKAKFGGSELEFSNVTDQANALRSDVESLKVAVSRLNETCGKHGNTEGAKFKEPELPEGEFPDDPQKGRFGGKSSRDYFELSASFKNARDDVTVVPLTLTVTSPKSILTGPVRFYLHSDFKPHDRVEVEVKDNKAILELLVVGGFTVGAWIEGTSTLLELDISKLRNAPRVVREL